MRLGIPGRVVEIDSTHNKLAMVDVGGVKRQVNISCVVDEQHPPQSCVGDWVLVHVGFAMSRINEQEAAQTLELLREMGECKPNWKRCAFPVELEFQTVFRAVAGKRAASA